MSIEVVGQYGGVLLPVISVAAPLLPVAEDTIVKEGPIIPVGSEDETTEPVPVAVEEQEAKNGRRVAKGMMRLLQEGHFKGVADLRHRINFHSQITALETEAQQQGASETVTELTESVDTALENWVSAGELSEEERASVEELQGALREEIGAALEAVRTSATMDISGLKVALSGALETLAGGLELLFGPAAEDPQAGVVPVEPQEVIEPQEPPEDIEPVEQPEASEPEEPVGGAQTVEETPVGPDVEVLREALEEIFTATLARLDEVSNTSILPELSPPSGRGRAYEKFLAVYNQLYGVEEPAGELDQEPVDIEA
jgi:hypothetical protein